MADLTERELGAAQALLTLRDEVIALLTPLLGEGETYASAADRLHNSYAMADLSVGLSSRQLVRVLLCVDAAMILATHDPVAVARANDAITHRRVHYGPAQRTLVQTLPPGG